LTILLDHVTADFPVDVPSGVEPEKKLKIKVAIMAAERGQIDVV